MRARRAHRATAALAAIATAVALSLAWPSLAAADEYPSWDEVEAAKADVASRESEANRIEALIGDLEAEAGRLGDAAVAAAAESRDADEAHRTATARAAALHARADAAQQAADASAGRFARVAALLSRDGGVAPTLRLLLRTGADRPTGRSDQLLSDLGRTTRLADLNAAAAARAAAGRATAAALTAQADVAASERDRLAREAADRAAAAQAAHEAAEARVLEQRATVQTLYEQLASLRDRTADLERRYRIGEQARAEAAAREAAAAAANAGLSTAPPPPGVVVDPAAAKAYARQAIGAYGWGDGEFRCLELLWTRESSWRADAYNASSGAYGIPQSLPGAKMASAGDDWRTNANTQINWGLAYISARYGAPCSAWAHSEAVNWY
ncbi:hypothetical protein [Agromyces larvae]|uniref:Lytic transglycosylase domain-containing protein n=1 Tax=Agromyces larvae TaxID=2929802 RepID=A0ABY4C1Q5_9MICO|nr:hypothetical protein [Agromyces larvae]UOE45129.1 hypothetical protein MTO99_04940 [Agromyces larvae]